jgi:hypothetical protein
MCTSLLRFWRVALDKSYDAVAATKEEWNELGFYYDYDKETREWIVEGSNEGLLAFVRILREYAGKEANRKVGEHHHLGPYMYLTIVTAESPKITDYGIFGSSADLARLSDILAACLEGSKVGDTIKVDSKYSNTNEAVLIIKVKSNSFDPSEPDDFSWAKK